ncbi:unnamed protein product [Moneuplotes crassus]|uniref:Uncharacterized protein n=1 Tax=Euplotes crassus TaxID=5936 RepID=A0AAD2D274_EUPCR|nr:unnamed protein product [Moneuplotes crassus]
MEYYSIKRKRRLSRERSLSSDSNSTTNSKIDDSMGVPESDRPNPFKKFRDRELGFRPFLKSKKRLKVLDTRDVMIRIPQRTRLTKSKFFMKLQKDNANIQKLKQIAREEIAKYQREASFLRYTKNIYSYLTTVLFKFMPKIHFLGHYFNFFCT